VQDQHFEVTMFEETGEPVAWAMSSAGAVPLTVPFVVRPAHKTPVFLAGIAV